MTRTRLKEEDVTEEERIPTASKHEWMWYVRNQAQRSEEDLTQKWVLHELSKLLIRFSGIILTGKTIWPALKLWVETSCDKLPNQAPSQPTTTILLWRKWIEFENQLRESARNYRSEQISSCQRPWLQNATISKSKWLCVKLLFCICLTNELENTTHASSNGTAKVRKQIFIQNQSKTDEGIEYLRGNSKDECAELFKKYNSCLMVCTWATLWIETAAENKTTESTQRSRHRHHAGRSETGLKRKWCRASQTLIVLGTFSNQKLCFYNEKRRHDSMKKISSLSEMEVNWKWQ